ncbi:TPA: DEAD/DEAH box helicase [Aeromonas hydrophila]|uniref:DEAD/DEAH box helicase n=1 Tax=Aeromonas hydrophila TaxID=644 RepID=UPI00083C989F|nr:DEAD/DEAH box helicase [Aeromonas hydrophila]OCX99607.1 DNA helicase [Aeromonas hydrophila]OCY09092.1 DNA helicase [Aeromonas hydrophila]HAU4877556.1 DEAD/DEAH box helicase [Aeromonas hydrophila]HAU4922737.1 DEAD/DEAH box helicase [Aeromonas hydrophila]
MARLDEQRRNLAEIIRYSRAAENELTPAQARLFVRSLQTSWHVPTISWAARESREQFEDARRLLHAASIFRDVDGEESADALGCYRRAAELLEWLARASDSVTRDVPVGLLAAGAYQLAGLPAMATSLLRQGRYGGGVAEIFAAFLSADFERVLGRSADFWNDHPELTGRDGSALLLNGDADAAGGDDESTIDEEPEGVPLRAQGTLPVMSEAASPTSRIGWYIVVELVRAAGLFADSIRRNNDERLSLSLNKLSGLRSMATRLVSDELWVLINLIETTSKRFAGNSLHSRMAQLAARAPNFQQRMWRFAREQFARGRGILWRSQVQGLERLIESDSFALCTPTGSGKTLVANLALVKELLLVDVEAGEPAPLAIYLVPSRALAGEVEAKLTAELGEDLIVTALYGGADWGITDYWLTATRPVVLIATVEKAEALMRYVGHLLVHRIRLLVVDEAHQVVNVGDINAMQNLAAHSSRSMRLEAMVSRLLMVKPDMARIALTAVAGGAALPVAQWIEGNADATPVGLGYRSSRQIIGALQCGPNRAPEAILDIMNGQELYVRGRDAPVYLPLRIPAMQLPPASIRNSLPHYTQLYVLWTALHLLEGSRRVLISVAQSPELLMKRFAEAFLLPGWESLPSFELPTDPILRMRFEETRAACIDYCGVSSYELTLLDRGIATSHGQMPQRLRRLMTALIDYRVCPITLATATLTEGVNLPFDIIFVTSLERRSFDLNTGHQIVIPMSTSEFRNLAGRAGRPGAAESIEGMTLVVLPQAPSTTAAGSRQTQLRQIQHANEVYNNLLARLQTEEAGAVHSPLAVLLYSITQKAMQLFGLQGENQLFAWLEATLPDNVGVNLGVESHNHADQLGDSLDELDGFILSATEELALLTDESVDGARVEAYLRDLWQRTFARVTAAQEAFLERSFIKRGRAFVERLYPDSEQRRRLYHYGFTPYVGRRFEPVAPQLIAELRGAADFGGLSVEDRFQLLFRLGELIRTEPAIGFRARATVSDQAILANWSGVLGWWVRRPGTLSPSPDLLRAWQRFVSENLEFRLGVAVGAAVAQVWAQNADGLETPALETWRETTGLPWIGFWFRELLRWGTLDPFVAFALAQGLALTRDEAAVLRLEFEAWLTAEGFDHEPEILIDPQLFLAWQRAHVRQEEPEEVIRASFAQLTGVDGQRGTYDVRPILRDGGVVWLDAAGYSVARSPYSAALVTGTPERHDYRVTVGTAIEVIRTF